MNEGFFVVYHVERGGRSVVGNTPVCGAGIRGSCPLAHPKNMDKDRKNIIGNGVPEIFIGSGSISMAEYCQSYIPIQMTDKNLVVRGIIDDLKSAPDLKYKDLYNRKVCEQLDTILDRRPGAEIDKAAALRQELGGDKTSINLLELSEWVLLKKIYEGIGPDQISKYISKERARKVSILVQEANKFAANFIDKEGLKSDRQAFSDFTDLWVIINTSLPYPFNEGATKQSVLLQMARSFFRDDDFTVTTLICMSYIHKTQSNPGTIRVTPGPILKTKGRDNDDIDALVKFSNTVKTLKGFLGERVKAYATLSDIDFVDVFKVSDLQAINEAKVYFQNYSSLASQFGVIPVSFLKILEENPETASKYYAAQRDLFQNINAAQSKTDWVKDPRFYYNINFINSLTQSIYDYYNSLPGVTMTRETAYQNTISKLLVYGAQPEVLRSIFPNKFVFISSETPVRDAMYIPRDKALRNENMTIIYPFEFKKQEI